jgi:hypothetical protein
MIDASLRIGPKGAKGRFWRRSRGLAARRRVLARAINSVGILLSATLIYLALGELAVRIALRAPILAFHDFRHDYAAGTINQAIEYDSLLGWRLKPFIKSTGFHTLEHGFRSNGGADAKVLSGGVLVVGSSFTAGSEVNDEQTWPAHLQQITGWDVNNGGQGGYQADQIVLLAEQLLPLIHPQVVVVDLIPGTIIGTGYASYGWPKPYFTVENGELVLHRPPEPHSEPRDHDHFDVKRFLGHFAVVNKFMATFFPGFWFRSEVNDFATVSTDEVAVTCRLLELLKQKSDAANARLILSMQYGALEIADASRRAITSSNTTTNARQTSRVGRLYEAKRWLTNKLKPLLLGTPPGAPDWYEGVLEVSQCARNLNIRTVDELDFLVAAYKKNPDELRKYYQTEPDGALGHKSSFGNTEVAKLVASAIGELAPPADQKSK